jgi:hypothetical protein
MYQEEAPEMETEGYKLHSVPRHCSLDGFAEISNSLEGVALKMLRPRDTIHARTRNSDYRIVLVDPEQGRVTVQGGKFFMEPVAAVVSGSTLGGCMLKLGWLGLGLRIEICADGQRIVTSPVQSFFIERP